jgi:methionyl-tRNA formyltransferase
VGTFLRVMNLIFMGTPEFAAPSLEAVMDAGHRILAVFTQPDKPVGRKQIITPSPVKALAQKSGLKVLQPAKLKTTEARAELEPILKQADACVVAAYGRILPEWMLAAPRYGCVNVHSSLLPKYRGAAPIHWAIANGEPETGVTIMQMDVGMDTGDILLQGRMLIREKETVGELTPRLARMGAELLVETLGRLEHGGLRPEPQLELEATYAPILKREDGLIDWNLSAQQIFNRRRGFTPFPGCYSFLRGQRIELIEVAVEQDVEALFTGVVCDLTREDFAISCGGSSRLRVLGLQPAGKQPMSSKAFLNGAKLALGDHFHSEPS